MYRYCTINTPKPPSSGVKGFEGRRVERSLAVSKLERKKEHRSCRVV